jgi:RNA polymerase sigma-70 factor (ECF subfamily)
MVTGNPGAAADVRLIERIVARDQSALAQLYDRHCRLLFTLILRILKDRGEAEDVLQEVFVRVWDRADRYDQALGAPAAWLARISRNRAIDRLRARAVRADLAVASSDPMPPSADPAPSGDPESLAVTSEQRHAIAAALAGLPDNQRALIESAFFEGYTQSELAERFDLPLGTVKTRIRTGMQTLKRALDAFGRGGRS